jgi:predicted small lipoprotein YifL
VKGKEIMKTTFSVVFLAILLVGCGAQEGPGVRPPTESAENKTQHAKPDDRMVEPTEPDEVFPHVEASYRKGSLGWIEAFCKQRGIRALDRERVRLFVQPMGVVAEAIEVDLANRKLTVYPPTHSNKQIIQVPLDEEQIAQIRALVTSPEFRQIPPENKKIGMDGSSYMVETSIGDGYSWKLHWAPDDKEFITVVDQIRALAVKKSTEPSAEL